MTIYQFLVKATCSHEPSSSTALDLQSVAALISVHGYTLLQNNFSPFSKPWFSFSCLWSLFIFLPHPTSTPVTLDPTVTLCVLSSAWSVLVLFRASSFVDAFSHHRLWLPPGQCLANFSSHIQLLHLCLHLYYPNQCLYCILCIAIFLFPLLSYHIAPQLHVIILVFSGFDLSFPVLLNQCYSNQIQAMNCALIYVR